ncbi:hypothetical protein FHS81_002678 [Pseudochelatococcus contaminans]|uniref:Uncharacterized protein n=1 Tax=Pseudochelatococcus contaminans TaxID=1538103 RepID=A0A7W6EHZ6_9HYPH|nr:hypothetical protein [Pseudochelatococcus contaminans]
MAELPEAARSDLQNSTSAQRQSRTLRPYRKADFQSPTV